MVSIAVCVEDIISLKPVTGRYMEEQSMIEKDDLPSTFSCEEAEDNEDCATNGSNMTMGV